MKKERAIIIKDPRLRRVRNEFRILLKLWTSKVISDLLDKSIVYIENHEDGKLRENHNKISELKLNLELSICYCRSCGRNTLDMVYVPSMNQWICVECNSKRLYFAELREEILTEMTTMDIEDFLERLSGGEGVALSRFGSKCNGYEDSRRILDEMGIIKDIQDKFLELCGYYGGYCDCEILLNAAREF